MASLEIAVLIPLVGMSALNETNSRLRKSSSHQALTPEVVSFRFVDAIHLHGGRRLAGEIHHLWSLGLHLKRHLKGSNPSIERIVRGSISEMLKIDLVEKFQLHLLQPFIPVAVLQVMNRRVSRLDSGMPDGSSLVSSRQECTRPVVDPSMPQRRTDGDESWQVRVLLTQAVEHPRTHARPDEGVASGVEGKQCSTMSVIGAVHTLDEADVIDHSRDVGKQITDPLPRLTVLLELPRRSHHPAILLRIGKGHSREWVRQRLAVILDQSRLVIEGVDL